MTGDGDICLWPAILLYYLRHTKTVQDSPWQSWTFVYYAIVQQFLQKALADDVI